MSDSPLDKPFLETVAEMRDHLDGMVTQRECPFCGVSQWTDFDEFIIPLPEAYRGGGPGAAGVWIKTDQTHPAIGFQCVGCGFLRLHLPPRFHR